MNMSNNSLFNSYECPCPAWSCAYNLDNPIYFFCGLSNGHVLLFDKREQVFSFCYKRNLRLK